MQQYHLYAYETLGQWHITMDFRDLNDREMPGTQLLYRGDHVPIDDDDPLIRAELILHQVLSDVAMANQGNMDILADRPASH